MKDELRRPGSHSAYSPPDAPQPPHPETAVLHAGFRHDPATLSTTVPLYLTNAYAFESVAHASDVFDLRTDGRTYSRLMNPTTDVLEQRLAVLEGGIAAVATSSGQAAIMLALLNIAQAGDNIVSSTQLYGGTINLLSTTFARLGIETRFADPGDPSAFAAATDDRTRAYFGEVLPNPMLIPLPLQELGRLANAHGIPLIVDNTMSPLICKPLEHGAHVVVHSTSKYICGHGTTIGGVVVDGGAFDWQAHADRFPLMTQPDMSHGEINWLDAAANLDGAYGHSPYLLKMRNTLMRDFGPCPSPFASFLMLQGLETLPLRMPRHCENAQMLARHLATHPRVGAISYPTCGTDAIRQQAARNMGPYGGPMMQLEVIDGLAGGRRFMERLKRVYHVSNIGDARTLATHPASTTHASIDAKARRASGVNDGTIRLSVGLEHIDDIISDIDQALAHD